MMAQLHISLEGDNAWTDLKEHPERIIHTTNDWHVAALSGGMNSGRPSVAIRIDLPDGQVVIAETSMRLFLGAAMTFMGRYSSELS